MSVGIGHLAYELPRSKKTVDELHAAGRVNSPAEVLRDFGFEDVYIDEDPDGLHDLQVAACRRVLAASGVGPDDLDAVIVYSGLLESTRAPRHPLELFRYPAARLRAELNLGAVSALAVSQQGCSGLFSSIDLASRLVRSSSRRRVLCVAGDRLPPGVTREIMYNTMSDAAAAVLVENDASKNQIIHFFEQVHPYYWDSPAREQELMASYFPMAQRTIVDCVRRAGLALSDIRWLVPHNVSLRSWEILARLLPFPEERIWARNIRRVGHTVSCDHVINLVDMMTEGALEPGDHLLLFTFGFGATWSCMIIRH